jgi:hypothetical protein
VAKFGKTYRIIIISNVCALFGAIQYSQTTAEFSFISWNKAFSMFPSATYVEQKAYMLTRSTEETVEACASYLGSDGIEIKTLSWDDTDAIVERSLAVGRRRVGDKSTWIIDLDTEGVQDPGRSDAVLESSTFEVVLYDDRVEGAPIHEEAPRYMIDCMALEHPSLRNVFVMAWERGNQGLSHFRRHCVDLSSYLDGVVVMQLMKISEDQRPPEYVYLLKKEVTASDLCGRIELPES